MTIEESPAAMADKMLAVLVCARRLEYLRCKEPLPPGALVVIQLGQSSPHALRVLDLDVHVGCPAFLRRLGSFASLQELRLRLGEFHLILPDMSAGDIGVVAGWSMPALQLFSWRAYPTDNRTAFSDDAHARWFDFLARGQFPALRTLELAVFEVDGWTTAAARRFLLAHPQIETASIETGRHGVEQLLPVLSCPRVRLVNTGPGDTPQGYCEFGGVISPRVQELVIELNTYWRNHIDLLDNIEDHQPAGLKRVVLVATDEAQYMPAAFTWPDFNADNNGPQMDGPEEDRIAADIGDDDASDEVVKDENSTEEDEEEEHDEDEDEDEDDDEDEDEDPEESDEDESEDSDSDASLSSESRFRSRVRRRAIRLRDIGIELLDEHRMTVDGRTLV
jgi:hypothetical protein